MADDNRNRGYRANDPYGRPRPAAQPSGDPLAELARLIGQQNESAPSYRQNGSPYNVQDAAPQGHWSPTRDPYAQDGYDRNPDAGYQDAQGYGEPQRDARYAPDGYGDRDYGYQDGRGHPYGDQPAYGSGYAPGQGYAEPSPYGYPPEDQAGYSDQGYAQQGYSHHGYAQHAPAGGEAGYSDPYYGQAPYTQSPYGQTPQMQDYRQPVYGQADYAFAQQADEHAPRRRGGIVTVLAVLALAVVGTAAAFGYRAMFGTAGTQMPPPVITADTRPSKVVPATDPNAKPIQDRVAVQTERILSREEQPVELRDPARAGPPRVIFPNLAGQNQPAANVAPAGTAGAAPQAEPKRIRTVTIKPDQGIEAPAAARAPAQPQTRSAAPTSVDDILNSTRAQATTQSANGPLALSPTAPQAQTQAQPQAQPQRQASRTPPNGSPFPAPISGNSAAATGPYAVQVTSQRSEADAQASFRSLQQQFPSVLGNRQPVIKRADLGEKGTYYRAQIPFGSQSEASEFCSSLKSAGGQCVVQRN